MTTWVASLACLCQPIRLFSQIVFLCSMTLELLCKLMHQGYLPICTLCCQIAVLCDIIGPRYRCRLWGAAWACAPIIEKRIGFHQLLPPLAPQYIGCQVYASGPGRVLHRLLPPIHGCILRSSGHRRAISHFDPFSFFV